MRAKAVRSGRLSSAPPSCSAHSARPDIEGRRLKRLTIAGRDESGRVSRLKLDGLDPDEISGQDFRVAVGRTIGWQRIKSTAFDVRVDRDVYRFTGHGYGHGVGLCVIGSARLADAGSSANAILARYFPGLTVGRAAAPVVARGVQHEAPRVVPEPRLEPAPPVVVPTPKAASPPAVPASAAVDVAVSLPDGNEGERDVVQKMAVRARDDLAARLGTARLPLVVRFHATTDDYERATGEPWFTSGAMVNGEVHLLPIGVLRERGLLERTVRHRDRPPADERGVREPAGLGQRGRGDLFRRRTSRAHRREAVAALSRVELGMSF